MDLGVSSLSGSLYGFYSSWACKDVAWLEANGVILSNLVRELQDPGTSPVLYQDGSGTISQPVAECVAVDGFTSPMPSRLEGTPLIAEKDAIVTSVNRPSAGLVSPIGSALGPF